MQKPLLLILDPQFEDPALGEAAWFCPDGAIVFYALQLNPHWVEQIDIEQISFVRPRRRVVELVGPDNQGLPMLIFADPADAPKDAMTAQGRAFVQGGRAITAALTAKFGGVGPHP